MRLVLGCEIAAVQHQKIKTKVQILLGQILGRDSNTVVLKLMLMSHRTRWCRECFFLRL